MDAPAEGSSRQPEPSREGNDGDWGWWRAGPGVRAAVAVGHRASSGVCSWGRIFIGGMQRVRLL